jgi:hypothetical protein
MPRRQETVENPKEHAEHVVIRGAFSDDVSLDEAVFLAALRRAVEGATTAGEERLARGTPDWTDRFGRICNRLTG